MFGTPICGKEEARQEKEEEVTVAELILKLQDLPQWLSIVIPSRNEEVDSVEVENVNLVTSYNTRKGQDEEVVELSE